MPSNGREGAGRRASALGAGARLLTVGLLLAVAPGPLRAQASERPLRLVGTDGAAHTVPTVRERGYAAFPAERLVALGWRPQRTDAGSWRIDGPGGARVELREDDPLLRWNGALVQLATAPYLAGESLHLPLQFVLDLLPRRMPDRFTADEEGRMVRALGRGAARTVRGRDQTDVPADGGATPPATPARPAPGQDRYVVIIDAGHGGVDPGAMGAGGTREKDVALALARALAEELRSVDGLEVHMTRDEDRLVPLWQRGEWATRRKGDRPGVFLSIHANALPRQRGARGFETYFLSEARTEHERRVAANENAPLAIERSRGETADDPDLDFILKELRNLDHQHWSALLAEMVQRRLKPIHPGPDRGVKQAPFAVITNALMPAVLVETGFITNRTEERLLADPAFHRDAARALALAVLDFFERYPPGRNAELEGPR